MKASQNKVRPELLNSRSRFIRRQPWENIATAIIAAGVVMLLQPLSLTLYSYSLVTMLTGIILFMIVSKFPE
jgi:hypothetical protein